MRSLFRLVRCLWLLTVCTGMPLLPAFSQTVSEKALPNFHTVAPGIYRGAAPNVAGLKQLRTRGVDTILDLRISPRRVRQEKAEAQRLGFRWLNLPMGKEAPTSRQVATFLSTLNLAPSIWCCA